MEGVDPKGGGFFSFLATQSGNEVILECADDYFRGITLVQVWWYKLEVYLLFMHEVF